VKSNMATASTPAEAEAEAQPRGAVDARRRWEPRRAARHIARYNRFLYFNISLRLLTLLAHAERNGYITQLDVRRLFSRNKRGKKSYAFIYDAVANGYLRRVGPRRSGDAAYTLTEKGVEALAVAREMLDAPK